MSRLVLLCGESPLPVWVSAITLNATDVVLVHGDGSSVDVAKSVGNALTARDVKVETFRISPFDPAATQRALRENAERVLVGRSMVYGPGTSAMNVAAYGAWLLANLDHPDTDAWWPESRTGRLHSLLGRSVPFAEPGIDLTGIAALHNTTWSLALGHDLRERAGSLSGEDQRLTGRLISNWLQQPEQETKTLRPLVPVSLRSLASGVRNSGWMLELATGVLLTRWFTAEGLAADEVWMNTRALASGEVIAEFDVVLRWGERVLCVTCGKAAKYNQLRHKLFEVDSRAPQVFGRETRSLTVALARDDISRPWTGGRASVTTTWQQRRRRLGVAWEARPRNAIVAARELFGPSPRDCLSQPESVIDQHNRDLRAWLLGCATR